MCSREIVGVVGSAGLEPGLPAHEIRVHVLRVLDEDGAIYGRSAARDADPDIEPPGGMVRRDVARRARSLGVAELAPLVDERLLGLQDDLRSGDAAGQEAEALRRGLDVVVLVGGLRRTAGHLDRAEGEDRPRIDRDLDLDGPRQGRVRRQRLDRPAVHRDGEGRP